MRAETPTRGVPHGRSDPHGAPDPELHLPGHAAVARCSSAIAARRARGRRRPGFDAVFVMDHFYQLPMLGPTRPRDARGVPAARARSRRDLARAARHARRREHLPEPGAPREDRHHARRRSRAAARSSASARAGSSPSTRATASTSRRSASGCRGSTKRSRSSARCCAARSRPFEGRYYRTQEALNVPRAGRSRAARAILIGGTGEQRTLKLRRRAMRTRATGPARPRSSRASSRRSTSTARRSGASAATST
mgnify:CR=1 FL=1